jgi:hypothetical protein
MAIQNLSFLTAHVCLVVITVDHVLQKRFVQPVLQVSICQLEHVSFVAICALAA